MTEIVLNTQTGTSRIHCGEGAFAKYARQLKGEKNFVVTDTNVFALYKDAIFSAFGDDVDIKILPAGERSKTYGNLISIIGEMARAGITRDCTVIAFGGGVVGDIAGLAACLYMRGLRLVQIPTTLLAQVDSSVGGKTAVDFGKVKNLIGAFYQPAEVIADPVFLKTLPAREIRCGLGEIIKYGALDGGIYQKLSAAENIFDLNILGKITADCIRCKADVVEKDERETSGLRKTLNLGHTTGHAFELFYKRKSHGEFVLIGAYYELFIAKKKELVSDEYRDGLTKLINSVVKVPSYKNTEEAAKFAKLDKKNAADGKITLIVPASEGRCAEIKLGFEEYAAYLSDCAKSLEK